MPMTANGLAKLIEECGALLQTAGKKLAYYTTNEHPDGGTPLNERMEEEMAAVLAAIALVAELHGLDIDAIGERAEFKHDRFMGWHKMTDNNAHGIDAK
jgi:NTP pyrophosphatase (non-canonical NTP hydrolase)